VLRAVVALAAVAAVALAVAVATAAVVPPAIDFREPPPALPTTAKLAIASGHRDGRVAVWTARNRLGELCVGWRIGASTAPPSSFTCFRRGLEPPLVAVEYGGGAGGVSTWGVVAGIAGPGVARVAAVTLYGTRTVRDLGLRPAPGTANWRAFTTGQVAHPTSQNVEAHDASGRLVATHDGGSIHPSTVPTASGSLPAALPPGTPVIKVAPPTGSGIKPTGEPWSDVATSLPRSTRADEQAISVALAEVAVRAILTSHPGWIDDVGTWWNCSGRTIGRVVTFGFAAPATFGATLPSVGRPGGNFSYAVTVHKVLATDWTTMRVSVDANAAAVVGVDGFGVMLPGASDARTVPIETVVPAHDAGGPDSGDCWQSGD
jgi:hypothetical protein